MPADPSFSVGDYVEVIDDGGSSDPAVGLGTRHTVLDTDRPYKHQYVKLSDDPARWLLSGRVRLASCQPASKEPIMSTINLKPVIKHAAPVTQPPAESITITLTADQLRYLVMLAGMSSQHIANTLFGGEPSFRSRLFYEALRDVAIEANISKDNLMARGVHTRVS